MKARAIKEALSDEASVAVDLTPESIDWAGAFDRQALTEVAASLVEETVRITRKTIRDAQVDLDDIANVVLVGGSTRMPMVRDAIEDYFGRAPLTDLDPDLVVALGAGLQADLWLGISQRMKCFFSTFYPIFRPGNHGWSGGESDQPQYTHSSPAGPRIHNF